MTHYTKLDLQTAEMDEALAKAPIYAKTAVVRAWQVDSCSMKEFTKRSGADQYDIFLDEEDGAFKLRTFVMEGEGSDRRRVEECVKEVKEGDWIVTNPAQQEGDYPNRYVVDDATFQKRYELKAHSWITVDGDQFRAKGMARIIPNPTGNPIEIEAPWGGVQTGGADCYVCATYDRECPDEVSTNRYILSANDFANYSLAEEVLGPDWDHQSEEPSDAEFWAYAQDR